LFVDPKTIGNQSYGYRSEVNAINIVKIVRSTFVARTRVKPHLGALKERERGKGDRLGQKKEVLVTEKVGQPDVHRDYKKSF